MRRKPQNAVRAVSLAVLMICSVIGGGLTFTGSVAADHPDVDVTDLEGSGTESDPYVITTAPELQAMEDDLDANYVLGNDIDASNTAQFNDGRGFDPVGDDANGDIPPRFTGIFDGNNHTITGLTIDRPNELYVGLFRVNSGTVTDVTLTETTVSGDSFVGSLAGFNFDGEVQNVTISGDISSPKLAGGLVGTNNGTGTIQNVAVSGSVSGLSVGGITGFNSGTIRDTEASARVNGDSRVGGLVGYNARSETPSEIADSNASGSVTGGETVGGLVGDNFGGTIRNASASGSVTGSGDVGGLVGFHHSDKFADGTIRNVRATGSVTGDRQVGGLVGKSRETIRNGKASGGVVGVRRVGGLVGSNGGTITDTFAVGLVTGNRYVGGLVGQNTSGSDDGTIEQSYFDVRSTGQTTSAGTAVGLTTAEMQGSAAVKNMDGLELGTIWQTRTNPDNYPALLALKQEIPTEETDNTSLSDLSGNGTEINPYKISDVSELQAMEADLDANYELVSDIDASPTAQFNNGRGFDPIGSASDPFTGVLDGNNHTITGVTIDRPSESAVGLFGINSGTVTNITLTEMTITGNRDVGGLFGVNSGGTVRSATASGTVAGGTRVGGLLGSNFDGTIEDATAPVGVTGGRSVGGLVGDNFGGTIRNASASENVTANVYVGGLVGSNTGNISDAQASGDVVSDGSGVGIFPSSLGGLVGSNGGTIRNASATGRAVGERSVGGLVGDNFGGTIRNASASGSVSGTEQVGGLAGHNDDGGTIRNASASGSVTGGSAVGGFAGLNRGNVTDAFAVGSVTGDKNVGGFAGLRESFAEPGRVKQSYFDIEATGQDSTASFALGLTTADMQGESAQNTMSELNFETTWQTQPNDYPTLRALDEGGDESAEDPPTSPGDVTGNGNPATDPDGDGTFEDINGDGEANFDDAIALAFADTANLTQQQINTLDFDGDGDVDFNDAVELAFTI